MPSIGRAVATTCPACGVGEPTGLCTLTRGNPDPVPGSGGPVETLQCDCCGLWIRNGIVVERGVPLEPDDVRAIVRPRADDEAEDVYVAPELRPLRLVPTYAWADPSAPRWPEARELTSITWRYGRPRRREPRP